MVNDCSRSLIDCLGEVDVDVDGEGAARGLVGKRERTCEVDDCTICSIVCELCVERMSGPQHVDRQTDTSTGQETLTSKNL